MKVIDLFAGAGGWDLAARDLGFEPLGIEWMDEACATREAAGLRTLQADIATLDPLDYPCDGLIASPPCQAYSMAGKGAGRRDQEAVVRCALELGAGNDTRADRAKECEDERSILVVEPLRWALAIKPRWIAFEQVPPVLDLWSLFAQILGQLGYSTWVGVLSAERYGVPQTRRRAFLIASLDGPVHPPEPTHQAYVPGEAAKPAEADLFGDGPLPWVSMAQALGWTGEVGFPRAADGGAATEDGYRERDFRDAQEPAFNLTEKARSWTRAFRKVYGEGMIERHGDRAPVPDTEPAPVITSKARSAEWVSVGTDDVLAGGDALQPSGASEDDDGLAVVGALDVQVDGDAVDVDGGGGDALIAHADNYPQPAPGVKEGGSRPLAMSVNNDRPERQEAGAGNKPRPVDAPAATVDSTSRQATWLRAGTNENDVSRAEDQPAPTLRFGERMNDVSWVQDRPAPTVVGGRRSSEGIIVGRQLPAGEDRSVGGWSDVEGAPKKDGDAVRVSQREAAILQTFPADYPWQGSRSRQFLQIGNAVPPVMARAVLAAALAPTKTPREG